MTLRHLLEWEGHTVAWDRFGEGPPLVLLNGTPWSSALWRPVADSLADRFTVHVWDMPGYGLSSKGADHPVDLGLQTELFVHILDEWGPERPHVTAHDYGGAVSLRARLIHDVRCASRCLVDVVALRPWGSPFFDLVKQHPGVFAALRRKSTAVRWRYTSRVRATVAPREEELVMLVDRAHRLKAAIPGSTLALVEDAGHLIQIDAPERLTTELVRWTEGRIPA